MTQQPTDPVAEWTVTHGVVDEVDGYSKSVAGIAIEAVRTGRGTKPNEVHAASGDLFTMSSCSIGFPMRNRMTVPEERFIAAVVTAAPPGARWCDIDLHDGTLFVYGPEAEHTAVNLPGLEFTFVTADLARLTGSAEALGLPVGIPPRGRVHELAVVDGTRALGPALSAFARAARRNDALDRLAPDVMRAVVSALSDEHSLRRSGAARRIDNRHVVHACIDYADRTERIPAISELCLAAHVSERKLREAFVCEFDLPPSQYFRNWALEAAHRRLRRADSSERSVTEIATDVGFHHLGRFASHYRALYGESPSTTLRRPERRAS